MLHRGDNSEHAFWRLVTISFAVFNITFSFRTLYPQLLNEKSGPFTLSINTRVHYISDTMSVPGMAHCLQGAYSLVHDKQIRNHITLFFINQPGMRMQE